MLIDPAAADALAQQGFVVIDLLQPDDVATLRAAWAANLAEHEPVWDPTGMATTVRHPGSDRLADASIRPVVSAALAPHLEGEEPFLSAFITKRAGSGELPPHLDWSLVDETQDATYGCWVALEDITGNNGVLGVIPGSHRLVDFPRTPAEPGHTWVQHLVAGGATMVSVPTSAGQAVIFDHRLVHFSSPNESGAARAVANIGLAPAGRAAEVRQRLLDNMRIAAASQIDPERAGQAHDAGSFEPESEGEIDAGKPVGNATVPRVERVVRAARPATVWRRWSGRLRRGTSPSAATDVRHEPIPDIDLATDLGSPPVAGPPPGGDDLSRFEHRLVRDPATREALRTSGAVLCRGAVPPEVVAELAALYDRAMDRHRGELPECWHPTGMLLDQELQRLTHDEATRLVQPYLDALLFPGAGRCSTGSFAVKPPGPQSLLGMHQDVSMVDERVGFTINAWIPLVRSTPENGALRFVAGSHRFGNVHRSLAFPWAFDGHHEAMERHAQVLEADVGDLILFDTGTIHGSQANETPRTRVALQCLIVPSAFQTEHLVIDEHTPAGCVDVYRFEPLDHLLGNGIDAPEDTRPVDTRPLIAPAPSLAEFDGWCASYAGLPIR